LDINSASRQTLDQLIADGHLTALIRAGARLHQTGCNGCIGMGQVPAAGRRSLRTVPRNFPGRSGDSYVERARDKGDHGIAVFSPYCESSSCTVPFGTDLANSNCASTTTRFACATTCRRQVDILLTAWKRKQREQRKQRDEDGSR
jgi:aconitase family protein (aconitate hydratase)